MDCGCVVALNCAVVFTYSESDNSLVAECLFVSTMCYILGGHGTADPSFLCKQEDVESCLRMLCGHVHG
jgi:hypothetical protein